MEGTFTTLVRQRWLQPPTTSDLRTVTFDLGRASSWCGHNHNAADRGRNACMQPVAGLPLVRFCLPPVTMDRVTVIQLPPQLQASSCPTLTLRPSPCQSLPLHLLLFIRQLTEPTPQGCDCPLSSKPCSNLRPTAGAASAPSTGNLHDGNATLNEYLGQQYPWTRDLLLAPSPTSEPHCQLKGGHREVWKNGVPCAHDRQQGLWRLAQPAWTFDRVPSSMMSQPLL